jgi:hypothetical protein
MAHQNVEVDWNHHVRSFVKSNHVTGSSAHHQNSRRSPHDAADVPRTRTSASRSTVNAGGVVVPPPPPPSSSSHYPQQVSGPGPANHMVQRRSDETDKSSSSGNAGPSHSRHGGGDGTVATKTVATGATGVPVDLDEFLMNPSKFEEEEDDDDDDNASQESLLDDYDDSSRHQPKYWEEIEPRRYFDNPTNRRLLDNDASNIPGTFVLSSSFWDHVFVDCTFHQCHLWCFLS